MHDTKRPVQEIWEAAFQSGKQPLGNWPEKQKKK
jgi:hypothetical protein